MSLSLWQIFIMSRRDSIHFDFKIYGLQLTESMDLVWLDDIGIQLSVVVCIS